MLEEVNGGRTDTGPMLARIVKARAYEQHPDVFAVSVNGGFGNADITEVGPTVLVTGQGDFTAHYAFAEDIADDIWAKRFDMINRFLSVGDAATACLQHDARSGPIVVADYADNPGGGAYGDGTALLRALLTAGVENACFGPMIDPEAAASLQVRNVGEMITLSIGGKTDPHIGGGPLSVTGMLKLLSVGDYTGDGPMLGGLARSWGPTAVLAIDGVDILIVTARSQIYDQQQFKAFGIDPAQKAIVALKSMQHFRAAFAPIAARIIVCDSGALCTPNLAKLPYKHVPRPIFPLDL
jgi:microcystin degradation protein MlrC